MDISFCFLSVFREQFPVSTEYFSNDSKIRISICKVHPGTDFEAHDSNPHVSRIYIVLLRSFC